MLDLVISTVSAHFSALNLKKLYLGTPMPRYKYLWIPIWYIPDEIIEEYQLAGLVQNGHILLEIRKGMY